MIHIIRNRLHQLFNSVADRMAPLGIQAVDSLMYWRARILATILISGLGLTIIALIASVFVAVQNDLWRLVWINGLGYLLGLYLLLSRRLSYRLRAAVVMLLFYAVGVYVVILIGPLSGGPAWLFAFAVMVGVLLGPGPALIAVTMNAVTLAIISALIITGRFGVEFPFFDSAVMMITAGINFTLLNLISALSVAALVKGLVSTHRKEKNLTDQLRAESEQLKAAKAKLENEIEERRQLEDRARHLSRRLQRAQKMEAIGTLAGGVAHDLNNILSGIVSYPDLILLDMPADHPLYAGLLAIKSSGEKAAAIVQDLLTLARRGVQVTEVLDMAQILSEYLSSPEFERLQHQSPAVKVRTRLGHAPQRVKGSKAHLQKTLMNLVQNAFEAMPQGGTVWLESRTVAIDPGHPQYGQLGAADHIQITVRDSGIGIAAEDLDRIFEPFYSKKKMGRSGTGLGMAVVWGTIEDHGGTIDVQSVPDGGTTFHIYLPVTDEHLRGERATPSISELQGSGQHILVVDDVGEQRQIATNILKRLGYLVTSVSSGEEALELIRSTPFDLVVLDMIMTPGMDGLETFRRLIELRPGVKAVITSGYSETDRVQQAQRIGAGTYIRKPYTMDKLGQAVQLELRRHES